MSKNNKKKTSPQTPDTGHSSDNASSQAESGEKFQTYYED